MHKMLFSAPLPSKHFELRPELVLDLIFLEALFPTRSPVRKNHARTLRIKDNSQRRMVLRFALGILSGVFLNGLIAMGGSGPLRSNPDNPRYFTDSRGKAIYLTGSHVWNNLRDFSDADSPSSFAYGKYLGFLKDRNHNFIRLWSWDLPNFVYHDRKYYIDPFPWLRIGPGWANDGKRRFDLSKFNQAYFDRLRERVLAAQKLNIYVSIMLFEGYALQRYRSPDDGFPFESVNNINGIEAQGTSSNTLQHSTVNALQVMYVKKIIDSVNDLDNVLYEICNESGPYSTQWQYSLISLVKNYEGTKPKRHPVGMTFQYSGGSNRTLFSGPADWISPNADGGYKDDPPIPHDRKVIISDTDHLWGEGGDARWVWKSFVRGLNTLFMDGGITAFPPSPDWREPVRKAMGHTLTYATKMNLVKMTPQRSSNACSTRYCLVNPGKEYLAYQPGSGAFRINLSAGTYAYEWFNPAAGHIVQTGHIAVAGGEHSFSPPFYGNAVLYLKRTKYITSKRAGLK
jgi:hypothetical protein